MAKITIAGDAVVITSAMKLEDIKTIEKYRAKALQLMGGENNKEVIFAMGTTRGTGSISKYGASFGGVSHDDEKLATITLGIDVVRPVGDIKDWVADYVGSAIISLNTLEAKLGGVLEDIADEKAKVLSNITVV